MTTQSFGCLAPEFNPNAFPDTSAPGWFQLAPCPGGSAPVLPDKFIASTLMMPFTGNQMAVGKIVYDWSVQAMLFSVYLLDGGGVDYLITSNGLYYLYYVNPGTDPLCIGPYQVPDWQIFAPDFLQTNGATCEGQLPINQVDDFCIPTSWWRVAFGQPSPNYRLGNWFWFREDNGMLFRLMNINDSNPLHLPVLGNYSFVYFPLFQAVPDTPLPQFLANCPATPERMRELGVDLTLTADQIVNIPYLASLSKLSREATWEAITPLVPGLEACDGCDDGSCLPEFPATFDMYAVMTPINRPWPLPTEVVYDWPYQRQLTRMFFPAQNTDQIARIDAILTSNTTYQIQYNLDGTCQYMDNTPVGLPYQDWQRRDCQCMAKLVNSPVFGPNSTILLLLCPLGPNSQFWTWYTPAGVPVVFEQTNPTPDVGTSLSLADYYGFYPNVPVDTSIFNLPANCAKPPISTSPKRHLEQRG